MWTYTGPATAIGQPTECRKNGHDWSDPAADSAICLVCGMTRHRTTTKEN